MHTLLEDDKSASYMRYVTLCPLLSLLSSRRNSKTDIETGDGIELHVFGLLDIDKSTETKDSRRWEIRRRERRDGWIGGGYEQW
jgi:hypothetical protein